jgi:hypothetical protein
MYKFIGRIVLIIVLTMVCLVAVFKFATYQNNIKTENNTQSQPTITGTFKIKDSICTSYKIGEEQGINSIKDSILIVCDPPLVGAIVN